MRKRSSKEPTGIRPLSQIHSAVTFIKVENKDFNEIKDAVLRFYKEKNIKGEIFFFDFRKIGKKEKVLTDTAKTIFSKGPQLVREAFERKSGSYAKKRGRYVYFA